LELSDALEKLELLDEQQAEIIEHRFFSGLNNDEIAEILGVSRTTVERELRIAKSWLYARLSGS